MDSTEVRMSVVGDERADATALGCCRGPVVRLGRGYRGGGGDGFDPQDDPQGHWGVGGWGGRPGLCSSAGACSSRRWRAEADPAIATGDLSGVGVAGGVHGPRRSAVSATMDLQEYAATDRGIAAGEVPGKSGDGGGVAEGGGLQSPSQPQDAGRAVASRPRRAVRAHQCHRTSLPRPRSAGRFRGHEEEGIGREFQERRAGVAPSRRAGRGSRSRFFGPHAGQGDSLRRIRRNEQRGLGERGHRSRHGPVRGGGVASVVEEDGIEALSAGQGTLDHRRWRRQQRFPVAFMESCVAGVGRSPWLTADGLPFSTGDEQVEQDRASDVLAHHHELARQTVGQSRGDRSIDRQHDDGHGFENPGGTRSPAISNGRKGLPRRTPTRAIDSSSFSWRLELCHLAGAINCNPYRCTSP